MIEKIISGGQIGADQAALDVAIKLGVPHGGWIQKGRKTQRGILPEKYHLKEMPVAGYKERIEQNVIDSDGTVILSHGALTGSADYSQKMAQDHKRPCLHIDLNETSVDMAASNIYTWIIENEIKVLNVTGSRTSEDAKIYKLTMAIMEEIIFLGLLKAKPGDHLTDYDQKDYINKLPILPKTVDEAVERLISNLELKEKVKIAHQNLDDLCNPNTPSYGYFKDVLSWLSGNKELMASCRSVSKLHVYNEEDAAWVIVEALREKVKQTHILRVVK